ncbi:MAG: hypothetical protein D6692_07305 [Planctomycetota bacterium]|nr:MAG: hypothetical protein D6692_07305 [Planctomycetota bacterium]
MHTDTLHDARGERRRICTIHEAVEASGVPLEDLAPPGDRATFWRGLVALGGVFTAIMTPLHAIAFGVMFGRRALFVMLPFIPVYFFGFGIPMALVSMRYGWRSARHARDAMLRHGLCPACAHGIAGIPPQGDGCVVCPECGAAWRVQAADQQSNQVVNR